MPDAPRREDGLDLDLLEYVLVAAHAADRLVPVAEAVTRLVGEGSIRLLDAVVLVRAQASAQVGATPVTEHHELAVLGGSMEGGVSLSPHDVQLAALTLDPDETALLLLVEDRWAGPLSDAAREGGARGITGERIARERVLRSLGRTGTTDLIVRGPGAAPEVDQVAQMRDLTRLVEQGLLPLDRYEVQRRRVLGD